MKIVRWLVSSFIHLIAGAVFVVVIALIAVVIAGYRPYVVLSGSMEPEIRTGSICLIDTGYRYEELKVGDVIAFTNGRISVTHRIHEIRDGLIQKEMQMRLPITILSVKGIILADIQVQFRLPGMQWHGFRQSGE